MARRMTSIDWSLQWENESSLCVGCSNNDPRMFVAGCSYAFAEDIEFCYMECLVCDKLIGEREWLVRHQAFIIMEMERSGHTDMFTPSLFLHDPDMTPDPSNQPRLPPRRSDDRPSYYQSLSSMLDNPEQGRTYTCSCGNSDRDQFQDITVEDGESVEKMRFCKICNVMTCEESPQREEQLSQSETKQRKKEPTTMTMDDMIFQCPCGNTDHDLYRVRKDDQNYPYEVECRKCGGIIGLGDVNVTACRCGKLADIKNKQLMLGGLMVQLQCPDCQLERDNLALLTESRKKRLVFTTPKTLITTIYDLRPADHIIWDRGLYWHHAIVVDIGYHTGLLKVIEYTHRFKKTNSDDSTKKRPWPLFQITEHWIDAQAEKSRLYRLDHKASLCNAPPTVIQRARSRLYEKLYDLLNNNCEHFALSAKLSLNISYQVERFKYALTTFGMRFVNAARGGGFLIRKKQSPINGLSIEMKQ